MYWSSLVTEMDPDKPPPCLWKAYAQFLLTPMMIFVLSVPISFLVNDISNIMAQKKFGVIRFVPYMASSTVLVVISMFWWCLKLDPKRKERPFRQPELSVDPNGGTEMNQTSQYFVLAIPDDKPAATIGPIPPVASGSDDTVASSRGGSQPVMNGDFSSDDPSSGSSGLGASDQARASLVSGGIDRNSEAQLESSSPSPSMFIAANVADIATLKKAVMAELEQCQSPFAVLVIKNPSIATLVEAIRPRANLPGSRVLHKRIEIGPQTGNWFDDFLRSEIMEPMRMAKMFDKDCTMQLGSLAIFKHTDAGLKCWMLQKDWTPVIVDVYRCPQSLLNLLLLASEFPKWRLRGFNLENATLKLEITETEKSTDLSILHHEKIDNGRDELWFEEPLSFPMFTNKVYISASNSVEVEAGMTFTLHSEAIKVQRASWISVLDGSINSPLAQIAAASWLFLPRFLLGNFVILERPVFLSASLLVTILSIGIAIYSLHVYGVEEGRSSEGFHGAGVSSVAVGTSALLGVAGLEIMAPNESANTELTAPKVSSTKELIAPNVSSTTELMAPNASATTELMALNESTNTELMTPNVSATTNLMASNPISTAELRTPDPIRLGLAAAGVLVAGVTGVANMAAAYSQYRANHPRKTETGRVDNYTATHHGYSLSQPQGYRVLLQAERYHGKVPPHRSNSTPTPPHTPFQYQDTRLSSSHHGPSHGSQHETGDGGWITLYKERRSRNTLPDTNIGIHTGRRPGYPIEMAWAHWHKFQSLSLDVGGTIAVVNWSEGSIAMYVHSPSLRKYFLNYSVSHVDLEAFRNFYSAYHVFFGILKNSWLILSNDDLKVVEDDRLCGVKSSNCWNLLGIQGHIPGGELVFVEMKRAALFGLIQCRSTDPALLSVDMVGDQRLQFVHVDTQYPNLKTKGDCCFSVFSFGTEGWAEQRVLVG